MHQDKRNKFPPINKLCKVKIKLLKYYYVNIDTFMQMYIFDANKCI